MEAVLQFLYGGLTLVCVAIGMFFVRYWHLQRDRLFIWFMLAFWSLAASWGAHLVYASAAETGAGIYLLRLASFLLISIGIVDKNRRAR